MCRMLTTHTVKKMNESRLDARQALLQRPLDKGPGQSIRLFLGEPINTASKRLLRRAHSKLNPYRQADKHAP